MRSFLARRWFLLLVTVGLSLALLRPGWLRPAVGPLPARGVVAVALFLTAWGLESRRLWRALTRPLPVLGALAISYGAVPALAWLAGPLLPLPDLRVGLLLIAAVPCTLASAVLWTRLAGGNEATALLVVLLSTATSWLATTAWLALGAGAAPPAARMMTDLLLVLVLPVGLAQASRALPAVARAAARGKTAAGVVGRLLVLVIMLKAAVEVARHLAELTPGVLAATAFVGLAVHLAGLYLGLAGGRALGLGRAEAIAVGFAGSQKTLPVALYLYQGYFVGAYPLAVLPLALYHLGQLVADTFVADRLAGPPAGKES